MRATTRVTTCRPEKTIILTLMKGAAILPNLLTTLLAGGGSAAAHAAVEEYVSKADYILLEKALGTAKEEREAMKLERDALLADKDKWAEPLAAMKLERDTATSLLSAKDGMQSFMPDFVHVMDPLIKDILGGSDLYYFELIRRANKVLYRGPEAHDFEISRGQRYRRFEDSPHHNQSVTSTNLLKKNFMLLGCLGES